MRAEVVLPVVGLVLFLSTTAMSAQTASYRPRVNADMLAVLDAHAALHPKPLPTLTPAEARRQPTPADAVNAVLQRLQKDNAAMALIPGVTHRDRMIAGAAGEIAARIYTPDGAGPFALIVYYHGGGWVIGSKEVYDGGARGLAKHANAVVVSVDYRLAPEHKFPAQHDDALAAYRWAAAHARELNADSSRMALAGESAGGNLAIATAIAVRDANLPMPLHILAVYPIAGSDTTTASYQEHAAAKPLDRPMMVWFFKHTAADSTDLRDPRIVLTQASLRGLPTTTIIAAEIDPLRSEGEQLEAALRTAGVSVERRQFDGVTHEFFGMASVVADALAAQRYASERLKATLNP